MTNVKLTGRLFKMIQQTSQLSLLDTIKEGKINKRQQQIIDFLSATKGYHNNNEIAHFTGLPINVVCPRVLELRKLGKIIEHKKMKDNVTNRLTIYWQLA